MSSSGSQPSSSSSTSPSPPPNPAVSGSSSTVIPNFTDNGASTQSQQSQSNHRPPVVLRHYFSQRSSLQQIRTTDLPFEQNAIGSYSPWGIFFGAVFLTAPLSYIYILLILLRELCVAFPDTIYQPIQHYLPWIALVVSTMQKSSRIVEAWCIIEAVFYVCLKLHLFYLQRMDPLERSLSSAPMLSPTERLVLWQRMVEAEADDPVSFITGWFFDQPLDTISKYDVRDFVVWSMFEGRNQEHLTYEELQQLDDFVDEIEWRISLHLYGAVKEEDEEEDDDNDNDAGEQAAAEDKTEGDDADAMIAVINGTTMDEAADSHIMIPKDRKTLRRSDRHPRPKQVFRFEEGSSDEPPGFFTNMYENYKQRFEKYRNMIDTADFHPVQDLRNFMAESKQAFVEAEEHAVARATNMCENAYNTVVAPGSNVDRQLHAIGHATQVQFTEAWNSVKGMKERLETADILSSQRKRIRQQMKGYRVLLHQMISSSTTVPSQQMAGLMRKITECNEAIERLEHSARDAFVNATGYARKNILPRREPQRYAKYSSDPLLGISTYPLAFHLLIYGATEFPLRAMLRKRGFNRLRLGPITYYYHPGTASVNDSDEDAERVPVIFVHGIGVGLITYMPLIDCLLKLGRPVILPEIPYVCGFRVLQSPNAVLPPTVVTSTMTAILATHGFLRGAFVGHSYGTSWLSYFCKYAPNAIAAALFLDPICFCLHVPRLTKQFVYHRPDPGAIQYMVRTDVTINWTIQRSFPWARIILFTEDIQVPYAVFLSDRDALVPAVKIESYLKSKGASVTDFSHVSKASFSEGDVTVCVFRDQGHGDWVDDPSTAPIIVECAEVLCERAEELLEQYVPLDG